MPDPSKTLIAMTTCLGFHWFSLRGIYITGKISLNLYQNHTSLVSPCILAYFPVFTQGQVRSSEKQQWWSVGEMNELREKEREREREREKERERER